MTTELKPIPAYVSRKDFVEAIRPLCELLNASPEEMGADVFITGDLIHFNVTAREEGDDGVFPRGIKPAAARFEFAELRESVWVKIND